MGFGKQGTGAILRETASVALGGLTNITAIKLASGLAITEDFRILKTELYAHIKNLTGGDGEGLLLGLANGELTVAEIVECIEADGPEDRNDRVLQERAERFVKLIAGVITPLGILNTQFLNENGGPMITVKPRWTFSDPEGWDYFVYNTSDDITTGATCTLTAVHYGVWVM